MTPRTDRPMRQIGRMGITETRKQPGDYYWNGRDKQGAGQNFNKAGGPINRSGSNIVPLGGGKDKSVCVG